MGTRPGWSGWALPCVLALGCGRTSASDLLEANAGGDASAGRGGTGGRAGASGGANGGSASGGASTGGAAAGGSDASGGHTFEPPPVIDPAAAARWTWSECGRIPARTRAVLAAEPLTAVNRWGVVYGDGAVEVVSSGQHVLIGKVALTTEESSFSFFSDGSSLAQLSGNRLTFYDLDGGAVPKSITVSEPCVGVGQRFSAGAKNYFLTWGGAALCVWRVADGALVRTVRERVYSASASGEFASTIGADSTGQPSRTVKIWGLGGNPDAELPLEFASGAEPAPIAEGPALLLSPKGDAVAGAAVDSAKQTKLYLWGADGHVRYSAPWDRTSGQLAFSPSGGTLLLGDRIIDVATAAARPSELDSTVSWRKWSIDDQGYRLLRVAPMAVGGAVESVDLHESPKAFLEEALPVETTPIGLFASRDGQRFIVVALNEHVSMHFDIANDFATSKVWLLPNVELALDASFSPDSGEFFLSGDGWKRLSSDSQKLLEEAVPPPDVGLSGVLTSVRYSQLGVFRALGHYDNEVDVYRTGVTSPVARLTTATYNSRVDFSPDDRLLAVTGPAVYRSNDWTLLWPKQVEPQTGSGLDGGRFGDVKFSADGASLLVTECASITAQTCRHSLVDAQTGRLTRDLTELEGSRAALSAEGHWALSNAVLAFLPNRSLRQLAPSKMSTFLPNGDIISVLEDSSIARYCIERPPAN